MFPKRGELVSPDSFLPARSECCGEQRRREHRQAQQLHRGRGVKTRHLPAAPVALRFITEYLEAVGRAGNGEGAHFRRVKNYRTGTIEKHLYSGSVYYGAVTHYANQAGIEASGAGVHSL